jgi:hypothetical protein
MMNASVTFNPESLQAYCMPYYYQEALPSYLPSAVKRTKDKHQWQYYATTDATQLQQKYFVTLIIS